MPSTRRWTSSRGRLRQQRPSPRAGDTAKGGGGTRGGTRSEARGGAARRWCGNGGGDARSYPLCAARASTCGVGAPGGRHWYTSASRGDTEAVGEGVVGKGPPHAAAGGWPSCWPPCHAHVRGGRMATSTIATPLPSALPHPPHRVDPMATSPSVPPPLPLPVPTRLPRALALRAHGHRGRDGHASGRRCGLPLHRTPLAASLSRALSSEVPPPAASFATRHQGPRCHHAKGRQPAVLPEGTENGKRGRCARRVWKRGAVGWVSMVALSAAAAPRPIAGAAASR